MPLDDEELQRLIEQAKRKSLELYQKQQKKKQLQWRTTRVSGLRERRETWVVLGERKESIRVG